MLRRSFVAAAVYAGVGLAGGLYYRTLTHHLGFTGRTQLSVLHTHFLVLGFLGFLVVVCLEAVFAFSTARAARWFEVCYHAGLILTGSMMAVKGSLDVLGVRYPPAALAGISGLGHVTITAGIVLLFVALAPAVRSLAQARAQTRDGGQG